jgi:hypothetical protein
VRIIAQGTAFLRETAIGCINFLYANSEFALGCADVGAIQSCAILK